ncbi:MAG: N-acetylneuraminate synthase family protein [Hydrogenophilus sp.]|nr:N-acetylneuraminate synthase family protein [Hydrogenophilus sp.]
MNPLAQPLIILELANNHMGDEAHARELIATFAEAISPYRAIWRFALKFQFRTLSTLLHPAHRSGSTHRYVRRFTETALSPDAFARLTDYARSLGYLLAATPFDEAAVDQIEQLRLDYLKIASAALTDWPLLERIATVAQPIIASTAGAALEDLDRVVSFFRHRQRPLALMHCVALYPTPPEQLNLGQIELLKRRYPDLPIGYSTHEPPDEYETAPIALALGATLFEKHIALPTDRYSPNAYSLSPSQLTRWLEALTRAHRLIGERLCRTTAGEAERASLFDLKRGLFARRAIAPGTSLTPDDYYLAYPPVPGQWTADDAGKYIQLTALTPIAADEPLTPTNTRREDQQALLRHHCRTIKEFLQRHPIPLPPAADLELSHHYGLERFPQYGMALLTIVNRAYCKKLLVLLPGQTHPEQYHKQKEETFILLAGTLTLTLDGQPHHLAAGQLVTIPPGVRHALTTQEGCIIEELSTTHYPSDSYYTDPAIHANPNRKTRITYWLDA